MTTRYILRPALPTLSLWVLLALVSISTASASEQTADKKINTPVAAIGGLTIFPAAYRYRPASRPTTYFIAAEDTPRTFARTRNHHLTALLDRNYLSNRNSLVNTIRTRRGLSLLTFYESHDRCLFFGINDRGFAGINFMPVRSLTRKKLSSSVTEIERHYESLVPDHVIHDADGSLLFKTIY